MKKTMALFTIAGLSMASEFDGVPDNELQLYKLPNGITALVHTVDDELRVLPIDYHPPRQTRPNRPISADDELRILPIDHPTHPSTKPNKPIYTDDELRALPLEYTHRPRAVFAEDDELRVLPIDYHPGSSHGPHVIYTDDDEFRVLPIDYHPPRQTRPNRPISADDDEFRVVPSAYTHALSKYGKNEKKPVSEEIAQNDDEFRLIGVGAGSLTHKNKNATETAKSADDADSELYLYKLPNGVTALVHTVDDELRVLPIDYHPPRQTRPSGSIWTDDELRILPIDHHTHPSTKPNKPIMADDDELRLIAVGPGSLAHKKKNATETAKPIEIKPKRFTTGADKINVNISSNAADDEMRFAHFIPQYRPKKEDVEKKAADNTLLELSNLLVESQEGARNGGFLGKRR